MEDNFTLSGESKKDEKKEIQDSIPIDDKLKEVIDTDSTKDEREEHGRSSTSKIERQESTWQRLHRKGLHPKKNLDLICFIFFCAGYMSCEKLLEIGNYKGAFVAGFVAGACAVYVYIGKKGDLAIILREYWLTWKSKVFGKQAEESKRELAKQQDLTIWDRIDK